LVTRLNSSTNPSNLPIVATANFIAGLVEPVKNSGTRDERLNLFTRYIIQDGRLKGWFAGVGVQWRGETFLGYELPTPAPTTASEIVAQRQAVMLPSFYTANLMFGTKTKIWGRPVRVQLNIENLFDEKYVNAYSAGGGQWGNPRTIALTSSFEF
jgi:outer membrane receptor for ferric coprogen and ferric-rhodotorulic acid